MALKVTMLGHTWTRVLNCRCHKYLNSATVSVCRTLDSSNRQYGTEVSNVEEERDDIIESEEALRDVSRLPKTLHDRMGHVLKPPQTGLDRDDDRWKFYPRERFVKHQRKLFAKYGYDSGVDPGVMWPSIEELEDIIEEERELEPTLQELWAQAKANREAREKEIMEREKRIEENLAKMPELLQAYRKRLQQRGQEKLAVQLKQKQLLDEARDYFGYKLHRHDPRLKELKQKKIEEEKLARRQRAREEKEKASLARAEAKAANLRAKMEAKEAESKAEVEDEEESEEDPGKK